MKRTTVYFAAVALCGVCSSVFALYSVSEKGTWPESWPKELEPLRKQSRTLVGPMIAQGHYEIPFTKREEFESAWPHILKVKSKRRASHSGARPEDGFFRGQTRGGSHPLSSRWYG